MATAHRESRPAQATRWVGWIVFGATVMVMIGVFNVINGLQAIVSDEVFVDGDEGLVVFDLTTWGWIHLILGLLVIVTAVALLTGATWARIVGAVLVMINMATQLTFLPAYPAYAVIIIALDLVVLWAIIVHGDEPGFE